MNRTRLQARPDILRKLKYHFANTDRVVPGGKQMRTRSRRAYCALVVGFAVAMSLSSLPMSAASAATSAGAAAGTDPGIGTPAALQNPNCDPSTKRIKFAHYAAAPCVKPWPAGSDNGGVTAQGVTKTSIKVVVLWHEPTAQQMSMKGAYLNQATGQNDPNAQKLGVEDYNEIFKHSYETWGRTVDLQFVKASGADEASQRADAVTVAAMKPFAVYDVASLGQAGGGGLVFDNQVSQQGVSYVFPPIATPKEQTRRFAVGGAEFVGKALAGHKAKWAGDDALKSQPRKFGIIYDNLFDIDYLKAQLKKYGVTLTAEAEYNLPTDASQYSTATQEQAPTLMTKLKAAGVNNVLTFTNYNGVGAATKAATSQQFFPEWTQVQFPNDLNILARTYFDQKQWAHAFGLAWFPPDVKDYVDPSLSLFQWYWGTDQGTAYSGAIPGLLGLYSGVQLAGPKLTKKTFAAGSEKNPGAGGYFSKSCCTMEVSQDPLVWGVSYGWWSPDTVAPGQAHIGGTAAGSWMYLNDAKRYIYNHFPKGEPKFFDKSKAVPAFDSLPATEPKFPAYPCDDCPSSGASAPAAASN